MGSSMIFPCGHFFHIQSLNGFVWVIHDWMVGIFKHHQKTSLKYSSSYNTQWDSDCIGYILHIPVIGTNHIMGLWLNMTGQ